jgi:hypothetical protein
MALAIGLDAIIFMASRLARTSGEECGALMVTSHELGFVANSDAPTRAFRTACTAGNSRRKVTRGFWLPHFLPLPPMRFRFVHTQLRNRLEYMTTKEKSPSDALWKTPFHTGFGQPKRTERVDGKATESAKR